MLQHRGVGKIIRREDIALDLTEDNFDLIQPAGVRRQPVKRHLKGEGQRGDSVRQLVGGTPGAIIQDQMQDFAGPCVGGRLQDAVLCPAPLPLLHRILCAPHSAGDPGVRPSGGSGGPTARYGHAVPRRTELYSSDSDGSTLPLASPSTQSDTWAEVRT